MHRHAKPDLDLCLCGKFPTAFYRVRYLSSRGPRILSLLYILQLLCALPLCLSGGFSSSPVSIRFLEIETFSQSVSYLKMNNVQLPAATHRKRVVPQSDLEATSSLKLGEDQNTHTLSLSEARLVINKVLENKRRGGKKYEESE